MKAWILFLCSSAGIFAITYFLLRPRDESSISPKEFKFMHCTKCGKEQGYNKKLAGAKCGRCKPGTEPGTLVGTIESYDGRKIDRWRKLKSAYLVEGVFFLFGLVRLLSRSGKADEKEQSAVMRCPNCQMKLRFRPKSAGKPGMCPRCKKKFVFPENAPFYFEGEEVGHTFK